MFQPDIALHEKRRLPDDDWLDPMTTLLTQNARPSVRQSESSSVRENEPPAVNDDEEDDDPPVSPWDSHIDPQLDAEYLRRYDDYTALH